jgi:anti-sigma regulatory factor (Ser/Thr protein kinase)
MTERPELRLTLPARTENVAVIRHALSGYAEAVGMDPVAIADLHTVVTEACTNVVIHAYGSHPGSIEVSASRQAETLRLIVRDRGVGIHPTPADAGSPSLRMGLPLIAALSDRFEINSVNGGTELRITMPLRSDEDGTGGPRPDEAAVASEPPTGTALSVKPGELVRPVLARVIAILAARSKLSVERLTEAVMIGDALAENTEQEFAGGSLGIALLDEDGALGLRLGPLTQGAGERLRDRLKIPGVEGSLEALADEVTVERANGDEYLLLRIAQ